MWPNDRPATVHVDTDLGGDTDDLCAFATVMNWPGMEITGITNIAERRRRRAGYVKYTFGQAGADW